MPMTAYTLKFEGGKSCTHLDPDNEPFEAVERGLRNIFGDRLLSITQGLDAQSVTDQNQQQDGGLVRMRL